MNSFENKILISGIRLLIFVIILLLYTVQIKAGEIALSFEPNDSAVDSYHIFSRLTSGSYDYNTPVATLGHSSCAQTCEVTFSIESNTSYYFTIRAIDSGNSSLDSDEILFSPEDFPNASPIANAGADQTVSEQITTTLNGAGSSDTDGSIQSYLWQQIDGEAVTINQATSQTATFLSPDVNSDGAALTFQLTVTDNCGVQSTDTMIINVTYDNAPPTSSAGEDQSVLEGTAVTLDASGSSDTDGSITTFLWQQTSGPAVTLQNANTSEASFLAPNVHSDGAVLTFILSVTDNGGLKATDTVTTTVSYVNTAPSANAGADQAIAEGANISMNGSQSTDGDGSITSYLWQQLSGTAVTLQNVGTSTASFTAPIITTDEATLTFSLTVTDNGGLKSTDIVNVTITHTNLSPTANAGSDQSVSNGATVTLSGTNSTDTDDGIALYEWVQTQGSTVTLSAVNTAQTTFETTDLSSSSHALIFQLTVSDTKGAQSTDTVSITVAASEVPTEPETEEVPAPDSEENETPSESSETEPAEEETSQEQPSPAVEEESPIISDEIDYENIDMMPSVEVFDSNESHKEWLLLSWNNYDNMNGESRITSGDIDGDGKDELIIGLGREHDSAIPNGIFQVLDDDYSHLAWGKIEWPDYNELNGESIPATGDLNGDGKDEIIIGLGNEGGGKVEIFSFNAGQVVHKEWLTLDWGEYNTGIGKTRPATGDIDGDQKDEIIIGLGPQLFDDVQPNGLFRVFDDDYTPLAWGEINWPEYNSINGESIPSSGDMDGDGIDDIIIGLGEGGKGKLPYFSFNTQEKEIMDNGWIEVNWQEYNDVVGETRPALGDIDGDNRDELIIGFGQEPVDPSIPGGFFLVLNDDYSPLSWSEIAWENYREFNGESYPASGDLDGDGEDEIIIGLGSTPSNNTPPVSDTPPATSGDTGDSGSSSGGGGGGCFITTLLNGP